MSILERREVTHSTNSRPLAELLACPGPIGEQLGSCAQRREYAAGEMIFVQNAPAEGLYLLLGGEYYRSAERREKRLHLGSLHSGDLAELASVLGEEGTHTYSLMAAAPSAVLLFPRAALLQSFSEYPPLRMRLLEELGREVSRAYRAVYIPRRTRVRAAGKRRSLRFTVPEWFRRAGKRGCTADPRQRRGCDHDRALVLRRAREQSSG